MKAAFGGLAAVFSLLVCGHARATDYVSGRVGFSAGTAGPDARYAASAGGSFEANIVPDVIGLRAAADVVLGGWFSSGRGNTLGLRPELAFFPGGDAARLRFFGSIKWQIAAIGIGRASAHWVDALELGPELEWRHPGQSWLRFRLGAYFAPARDAGGSFHWLGTAGALTIEYGPPLLAAVTVPERCVELPTRPCPK